MVASRSQIAAFFGLLTGLSFTVPAAAQDRMAATYGTIPPWTPTSPYVAPAPPPPVVDQWASWDPQYQMRVGESRATPGGLRVLHTAQAMIDQSVVVRGSCYDWVDAVFTQASGHRSDAFHGGRTHGPYAQVQDFQPGDWVLFVTGEYEGQVMTHSAIFIGWTDEAQRVAMMMSYPGQRREEPGRYGTYTLDRAYRIIRLSDELAAPSHHTRHGGHGSRHG